MKAVVCQHTELEVTEVADPVPAKGQVVLDVLACGICGSDLHARRHADELADAAAATGYPHAMRPRTGWCWATSSAAPWATTDRAASRVGSGRAPRSSPSHSCAARAACTRPGWCPPPGGYADGCWSSSR